MYRSCLLLILCWFGAFAYRIDYDLEELQGWKYADSAEENPECIKDIVIVLDTSRTIGSTHFEKVQSFLQKLVTNELLNVQQNRTRIGFVTFSKDNGDPETTRTGKRLDIGEKDDAEELGQYFLDLKWDDVEGGHTRTDLGLQIATEMFKDYKNEEPERDKYADVAIVITDGKPRGITNDDRDIALAAATALKAEGVLVIGAGVGEDFSAESTKDPEEVDRLRKFIKDMASTPENVVFEENFEDIDTIIGKLVAASCNVTTTPPPPPVQCKCPEEQKTQPFYTKLGESTVTIDFPDPRYKCYYDRGDDSKERYYAKLLDKEVRPPLPKDNKFPVGESTYNYVFFLDKYGPLVCPIIVVVRKGTYCGGAAYDDVAKVCCCGSIHNKKPGHKCCGTNYYNLGSHRCCDGSNLISASKICLD